MERELIWVNEQDEVIGYGEKLRTHRERRLHRAFSVYWYDASGGKVLLQRRARGKYHSGGVWTNTCCSHPYRHETLAQSLDRCMRDEIGTAPRFLTALSQREGEPLRPGGAIPCADASVTFAGRYLYRVSFGDLGEDEIDSVFLVVPDAALLKTVKANPAEIEELRWVTPQEVDRWLAESPDAFSAWFPGTWNLVKTILP